MLLFCSLVTIVLWLAYNSCVDAQHGNNYLTSCTYQYGVNLCIPRKYIYAIRICVQFVRVDFAGFGVIFITPDSVRPAQKVGPSAHAHRSLCSMRSKTIRLCSIVHFTGWMVRQVDELEHVVVAVLACISRSQATSDSARGREKWTVLRVIGEAAIELLSKCVIYTARVLFSPALHRLV